MPPYLPETQQSVIEFLSKLDISGIQIPFNPGEIFRQMDEQYPGNFAAKAALDMALWNLKSQLENKSIGELLGIQPRQFPLCTYTLGVSSFDEMKSKVNEAEQYGFELFKIKLNGRNDIETIENFRKLTHKRFAVDVNQGWESVDEAEELIRAIEHYEPVLIEQPLPVSDSDDMTALMAKFQLPFFADESCQTLQDIEDLPDYFDGVNIKLMKCGGISPAIEMIERANELGLSVLIGCMSESSVGCTAAAHLTPLADYADLDGPYLIANDPFSGMTVEQGRIKLNALTQRVAL